MEIITKFVMITNNSYKGYIVEILEIEDRCSLCFCIGLERALNGKEEQKEDFV